MTSNRYFFLIIIISMVLLNSCVSRKNLTYLKNKHKVTKTDYVDVNKGNSRNIEKYKILPYDNLFIRVVTPDPRWSEMFNTGSGEGAMTLESAILHGYAVGSDGNIEIPFVGKVNVKGKTISEVKSTLNSALSSYVTDASITVRLVNNNISIIGEVAHPGRYPLSKDRVTVFEALSLAGDISEFGDRKRILLIRPTLGEPFVRKISLLDRDVLNSEMYYVMPNDVIYTPPIKGRAFQRNISIYTLVLSILNTGFVVYALTQNN